MRKLFTLFVAVMASVGTLFAQSGTCGDNLVWIFDSSTKTLTIAGTGAMYDYDDSSQPWYSIRESIKTVTIGDGVTTIGRYAFYYIDITSITLPQTLTNIRYCGITKTKLTSITFPSSLKSIDGFALAYSSQLSQIKFEGTLPPTLGGSAFVNLKTGTKIKVPCGYADAYRNASGWSGLYTAIYSDCDEQRYDGNCGKNLLWVFNKSSNTLTISGTGAMYDYDDSSQPWYSIRESIKTVTIGDGVTTIGRYAFYYIDITSITLPQTLTDIRYCGITKTKLTSITFPSSLKSIDGFALAYSSQLSQIKFEGTLPPTLGGSAFVNLKTGTKIKVPCGYADAYRNASGWSGLSAAIEEDCNGEITPQYALIVLSNDINKGTVTGTGTYQQGTSVVISASAKGGYQFSEWSDGNTDNPRTLTITQDLALTAIFELDKCILASGYCGAEGDSTNLTWELSCDSVLMISGTGAMADWTVFKKAPWYNLRESILSVELKAGVTSIGKLAFRECASLTSITIPNSVTNIGYSAFEKCSSLTSIEIPNSVTIIEGQAFYGCSGMTSVEIPNSLTSIGGGTFEFCSSLTSIEIPNSVTNIGDYAFANCTGLTSIEIPNSITRIGTSVFAVCSSLTSIEIPNSVTSIGDNAFYQCTALTSIDIPGSVTSIGEYVFYRCNSLTSIVIPNSVTSIGKCVCANCSNLTSIVVENGNSVYDSRNNCNAIIETATNTLIAGCQSTIIPDGVTSIGDYAFGACSGLTSIEIPSSVTSIGEAAFSACSGLTSIEIPNSVTSIGEAAFSACSGLTSIEIPNRVKSIGFQTFSSCTGLTSIVIPNSVTSIGDYAFYKCSNLTSITNHATTPQNISTTVFDGYGDTPPVDRSACILYVPVERISAYQAADVWKEFTNIQPICPIASGTCGAQGDNLTWELSCDGDLTISGTGEMQNYESYAPWHEYYTRTLTVEEGVTTIGRVAFIGSHLEEVHLGSTVTRIGEAAFEACTLLRNVQLQENLKVIEFGAFQGDTLLESVVLPNSVDSIGNYAFAQCRNLTAPIYNDHIFARLPMSYQGHYITPEGISQIAGTAFETCEGLTEVTFSSTIEEIGDMAFSYCSALTSVNLSPFIGTLKSGAFYGCSSLTTAHLGKNMQKILYNPFDHCEQFTTLTLDEENPYFTLDKGILYSKDKTRLVLCPTAKRIALNDLSTTITSVAPGAMFFTTNVDSIAFPEGVTLMGDRVLVGSSVKYIVLPSTLDSIGDYALSIYHKNFQAIVSYAQAPPKVAGRLFVLSNTPDTLYVPFGAKEAYQNANGWSACSLIVELPDPCTPITYSVHGFSNDSTLGTVRVEELPEYVGFTATEASTIKMVYGGTVAGAQPKLEYSYDGSSWNTFSLNTVYNVAEGQTFFLRGNNPNGVSRRSDAYSYFVMTGSLEGSGDIMTLVDSTGNTKTAPAFSFYYLFRNCTALTKAPKLNATILNTSCYLKMFYGCTNLRHIEVDFTSWKGATDSYNYTQAWLSNASSEGTFVKPSDLTVVSGTDAIPSGWTVVNKKTGNTDADSYKSGAKIKLTAEPKENCHFVKWSDNIETNPRTFVLTQDTTFTAIFEKDKCLLASGTCGNNLTWELSCDSVLTISGTGEMTSNPWSTNYKTQIKEVVIKDGVTSIAHAAFFYCSNLQSATIPNSVATIYNYAFSECNNLTSLTLPGSVTSIGQEAFSRCTSLTTIEIPSSVTSIGNWAFAHCVGLTSVIIPNSVTSIGGGIFGGCSGITEIQVAADNNNYCSVDGVLFNKDQTTLVQYPCGKQGNYAIPNTVTTIGDAAFFAFKGQISITIPNSVTSLGDWAFDGCTGLTSITCEALTPPACGADEFYGVDKSIPVYVPYESIAAYQAANQWSEFTNILPIPGTDPCAGYPVTADDYATICSGETFTWYGESYTASVTETTVFDYTRTLTTINGCDSIVTLHLTVMEKLSSDTIATVIKGSSFNWHGVEYTAADPAPTYWYQSAVTGCDSIVTLHIEEIDPPCAPVSGTCGENLTWEWTCDSVLTISGTGEMGSWLYSSEVPWLSHMADIKAVVLQEGLTNIAVGAFNGCSNLTSIVIPSSVTSIGHQAFKDCSQLASITMSSNVTIFEDYAFKNCAALTSIDMPEGLTSVGKQAFFGCTGLTSVVIPDATTTIGELAFFGCTDLADVTMGDHVESIAYQAFYDCQSISSMALPSSLTTIGAQAFYGCTALTSMTMGNNVTSIGERAFDKCSNLASVNLSTAITAIEAFTFFKCSSLTSIEIPADVTSIGESAFQYCSSLASITVPEGVTNIGTYAFHSCTDMTSATFLGDVPSFGSVPFGGGNTCLLHVPCGTSAEYASAANVAAERVVEPVIMDYSVTSEDEARGSVSILERPTCEDQTLTIQAEANEGYQFYRWNDDATDNPYTLVLKQDTTLEATFLPNTADGIITEVNSNSVHMEWESKPWGNHGYWIYIYIDKDHKHWYCKMRFTWLGILDKFYWGPASRHYDPSEPNHVAPRQVRRMPARYYTDAEVISYDLTDLDDGQTYFFILEEVDEFEEALSAQAGVFVTPKKTPTDIDNVQNDNVQCTKKWINGHLYILRGEHIFDAQGHQIK